VDNEPIIVTLYSKKGDPESEEIRKWIEELNKTDEFKLVIIFPEEVKDFQGKFEDQMPGRSISIKTTNHQSKSGYRT
jgi:hypothetical protein